MKQFDLIKPYLIERRFHIIAGFLSLLAVDILQLFIPRIIKWAIDGITLQEISRGGLFKYAAAIIAAALLIVVFRYFWRILIMGSAKRAEEGIRQRLYNHVQTLPSTFFDHRTAGDIMAHATNDMNSIRLALGMGIVALTDTVILGIASIFFMAYINLELTVVALLPMPFVALVTKVLSKRLFNAYRDVQSSFSDLMESTRERFAGIKIIKAFNREDLENRAMNTESEIYIKKNMDLVKLRGLIIPVVILLNNFSVAILLGYGGRKAIYGHITPGDFVAFISYLGLLTWPVMAIGWVANLIQRGRASIDRINSILDVPSEAAVCEKKRYPLSPEQGLKDRGAETPNRCEFSEKIEGKIEFKSASFRYEEEGTSILSNIKIVQDQGKLLGIAGPPGSGKSTLASLIPRLYDLQTGYVSIDDTKVEQIPLDLLRESITFMPQEPFLFSGTIRDNLLFGKSNADEGEIEKVLRMAQLTETIKGFPKGIETVIGEKGVMLSGGQKQRIALARAFLKPDAPIMILDDPVSQVDMQTASRITKVIDAMIGKRTIIIISHRFSIFKKADHIIVLQQGRITEQGTHDALVDAGGYYAGAWRMQESNQ